MKTADQKWLRQRRSPDYEHGNRDAVRVVDLFCGCGGMTLGLAEAARNLGRGIDIRLALDFDESACRVFKANFPHARVECQPVELLLGEDLECVLTPMERAWRTELGQVDVVLGGPPCQGHSDLNNLTRRTDERNQLYAFMARAARVLDPSVVIVENVPAVTSDHGRVVESTEAALRNLGYRVGSHLVSLLPLGVPQRRKRHVLIATKSRLPSPAEIFRLVLARAQESGRDVRWAIGDLSGQPNGDPLHVASTISADNRRRIAWLYEHGEYDLPNDQRPVCHRNNNHTYKSVYGRLRWDRPAQTITTGFSSMGQGRYVHPSRRRTLTPREAARLQFFPDFFDFSVVARRSVWSEMIGNAVPPKLTMVLGAILIPHLY